MNKQFKPYPFTAKKYAARVPQLKDGVDAQRHAVTIVGGQPGSQRTHPAGLTATCSTWDRGLSDGMSRCS